MTTNREWLYSLDVADLAEWFDAEHVDGMSLKPVRNPETYAGEEDSREHLENDIAWKYAQVGFGPNMDEVICWLDRQAAITEREVEHDLMLAGRMAVEVERKRIAELTAERDEQLAELTAQVDELSQQLINARADREQYRELFSKAITQAADIVNLQP